MGAAPAVNPGGRARRGALKARGASSALRGRPSERGPPLWVLRAMALSLGRPETDGRRRDTHSGCPQLQTGFCKDRFEQLHFGNGVTYEQVQVPKQPLDHASANRKA